ncbi:MAG: hypothetical protein EOP06_16815 [Proteobacteria bacterium]|nr:MAG: hypothetical protein EOP06_16815 [Pseudomonadota bacterium]
MNFKLKIAVVSWVLASLLQAGEVEVYEAIIKKIEISENHTYIQGGVKGNPSRMVLIQFYSPGKLVKKYSTGDRLETIYKLASENRESALKDAPFYQETHPFLLYCRTGNDWYLASFEFRPGIRFRMYTASPLIEEGKMKLFHSSSPEETSFDKATLEALKKSYISE